MKRILLSLTAVLFAVVGWAQSEWKDITSDYIKNAAMSIDRDQTGLLWVVPITGLQRGIMCMAFMPVGELWKVRLVVPSRT